MRRASPDGQGSVRQADGSSRVPPYAACSLVTLYLIRYMIMRRDARMFKQAHGTSGTRLRRWSLSQYGSQTCR